MSPARAQRPVDPNAAPVEHDFKVEGIARVEGEGSLYLKIHEGEILESRFSIFEPPRYFERILVGRTPNEAIDIVARICGICPVAYQMSAVHAFEDLFGVRIDPGVRQLRRLLYCGEWIESHALHVYMLHAPDFLGYDSAIEMARDHREIVEHGLALKKVGNQIIRILGGRPIHPVSVRMGGFSRVPKRSELEELRPALHNATRIARDTVRLVSGFTAPTFERDMRLVSMRHSKEYPFNEGRIVSTDGIDVALGDWGEAFEEVHLDETNALHARTKSGEVYLMGPSSRVTLAGDQLHPLAAQALAASGLRKQIRRNPFWGIAARAVELVHACAEATDIVDGYVPPSEPLVPWTPRPGVAAWATEAPRGTCFHRYEVDERGLISKAQIVPPTSQNQGGIEADLTAFAPGILSLPHADAQHRLEQLIRSYDPCISCATHFLDLRIEEA